jgi:DNA-binding transcriptional LysR family regulator
VNIHHLELFYYVARHGGISEAVRNMPYGIQQPAVSAQIIQLEEHLGISLFQRRPFCLTQAGDRLYRFIQPFFQNIDNVAEELRGSALQLVRIGAADVILRDHLPEIIQRLREQFPSTKLILRSGYQADLLEWTRKGELDLALTLVDKNLPAGLQSRAVMHVPLVLLVNRKCKLRDAEQLWEQKRIVEPLLCLPQHEVICRKFQDGLRSRAVEWKPTIELSSLELIETYVENDYGFGLSLDLPDKKFSRQLRVLPLNGFPPVDFGLIWQGEPTPFVTALMQEVQRRAHILSGTCGAVAVRQDQPAPAVPSVTPPASA